MARQFWLSDAQWAVIEPLLPHLGGKPRVDDRRVISGILHRYREGPVLACRSGRVCPPLAFHLLRRRNLGQLRPRTTLFNRFDRWSEKGIWQGLLAALVACEDPPGLAMVDSTAVRGHRSAAGAKAGSKTRPSAARAAAPRPKSTRSPMALAASTP